MLGVPCLRPHSFKVSHIGFQARRVCIHDGMELLTPPCRLRRDVVQSVEDESQATGTFC